MMMCGVKNRGARRIVSPDYVECAGVHMKDEIAKEIVDELRLIREELQNLTMAIRSKTNNSENAYGGKSRKSYQGRPPYPRDPGHPGVKPHRNVRPGEPRSQWHQNFPKDKQ